MTATKLKQRQSMPVLDQAIAQLKASKDIWTRRDVGERITVLEEIKDALFSVSEKWALTAAREKQIPPGSPLVGEEWITGPYALMRMCNALIKTLSQMDGKKYLDGLSKRQLDNGQLALKILPVGIWDHLLLSGINIEVWMQDGVNRQNLASHSASAYDQPTDKRIGKVALVLGAGNIASIAPLDCFQKLFLENQVVILKMNPVNDYMGEILQLALAPLIKRDALRIVSGDGAAGAYLTNHSDVEEIHITGSGVTHDRIVWGEGALGKANKKAGTPINSRPITSELGAVCPTIVVPGPWSRADIRFQAENIATQKMHNSGFNCIACQALILPKSWDKTDQLMQQVEDVISGSDQRPAYYPGTSGRLDEFASRGDNIVKFSRGDAPDCVVENFNDAADVWFEGNEIFGPAMSTHRIDQDDPQAYLRAAISYANDKLHGTLGANIIIHPRTIAAIGKQKFEQIITDLHYGCIAINGWSAIGFFIVQAPWGAYPGHTLDDVQSGIDHVHNSYMLEKIERTVVHAPWRPFPRNLLSGGLTLLPKPPWFITNRKQHKMGMLLTYFEYRPGWLKIPRIFLNALLG